MEKNNLLDIDYLKKNNQRLYYFGLGFVQLVLNKYERVHFYNENLKAPNDEIHNHRYNFMSHILKGSFLNERYLLSIGKDYTLTNESCSKERELTNVVSIPTSVELLSSERYKQGDIYHIFYNEFHKVSYTGNTITYLKRSDIITDYAQVLYPVGKEILCPFATEYSEDQLWDIINETITK